MQQQLKTLLNTWTQANTVQQVYPDTSDEHVSYVMWKCESQTFITLFVCKVALTLCVSRTAKACRACSCWVSAFMPYKQTRQKPSLSSL